MMILDDIQHGHKTYQNIEFKTVIETMSLLLLKLKVKDHH